MRKKEARYLEKGVKRIKKEFFEKEIETENALVE